MVDPEIAFGPSSLLPPEPVGSSTPAQRCQGLTGMKAVSQNLVHSSICATDDIYACSPTMTLPNASEA